MKLHELRKLIKEEIKNLREEVNLENQILDALKHEVEFFNSEMSISDEAQQIQQTFIDSGKYKEYQSAEEFASDYFMFLEEMLGDDFTDLVGYGAQEEMLKNWF